MGALAVTVHHARVVAVAVLLLGMGACGDSERTVEEMRALAEQGDAEAQFNLGLMYRAAEGVPQDDVQAHMWFNLAATQLPGEDRDAAVRDRDVVAERMTAD